MKKKCLAIVLVLVLLVLVVSGIYYFTSKKETSQRIDKPTPSGGAYSIIYYQDNNGKPVSKTKAVKVEIIEYSQDGTELLRTYGLVGK